MTTVAREDREGQGGSWHYPHKIGSPYGNAQPSLTLPEPPLTCGFSEPPVRPSLSVTPAVAARRRLRRLALERAAVWELEFQRLQLRRRAERSERVRAHTRAAVLARQNRQPQPDPLPFQETQ